LQARTNEGEPRDRHTGGTLRVRGVSVRFQLPAGGLQLRPLNQSAETPRDGDDQVDHPVDRPADQFSGPPVAARIHGKPDEDDDRAD
jgi:hypothetical protein